MIHLQTSTYSSIEFFEHELPPIEELRALPWAINRVATVERTRTGVILNTFGFAGRLLIPGHAVVDINELVHGTADTCLRLARSSARVGRQALGGRRLVRADEAIASEFAIVCAAFLSAGAPRAYQREVLSTTRPRGRIVPRDTVRQHWSHGRLGHVVCASRLLSADTPLARVLLAASIRAERILRSNAALKIDTVLARQCMQRLAGAGPLTPRKDMMLASTLTSSRDLVGLADVLLSGVPVMPSESAPESAFSAWISIDRVFEDAVFAVVQRLANAAVVTRGRNESCDIWKEIPAGGKGKAADPDVVVRTGSETWILDAKYRASGEHFGETELYQLLAHASAYGATRAALVTPALYAPPTVRLVGVDAAGCAVSVVSVDSADRSSIETQLARWLHPGNVT